MTVPNLTFLLLFSSSVNVPIGLGQKIICDDCLSYHDGEGAGELDADFISLKLSRYMSW